MTWRLRKSKRDCCQQFAGTVKHCSVHLRLPVLEKLNILVMSNRITIADVNSCSLFWRNCRIYCLGNQDTVFLCLIELNISEEEEKTLKGLLYFYASPRRVYSEWQIVIVLLFTLVCACSDPSSLRKHMKSHWLHLFDFSPLCVFKCVLKLPAR